MAFASRGQVARAYRLALRAGERGAAPDATLQRLLYPLPRATELADEAAKTGIDPLLAAAIKAVFEDGSVTELFGGEA